MICGQRKRGRLSPPQWKKSNRKSTFSPQIAGLRALRSSAARTSLQFRNRLHPLWCRAVALLSAANCVIPVRPGFETPPALTVYRRGAPQGRPLSGRNELAPSLRQRSLRPVSFAEFTPARSRLPEPHDAAGQ
jgi:hypothetical protein